MDASLDPVRAEMLAMLPRLRRFALALTGRAAEADDLVQDTVERALRNIDRWTPGTRMDSWMFRIAQNHWIDTLRSRRVRGQPVAIEEAEHLAVDGARAAEASITLSQTRLALAQLPEEQRSAVALVLIEGLSYREAAQILGVPIGTVTSRLSRAREALVLRVFGKDAEGTMP
jgi:RNA polymerase sigma-70 factor (ECF subfamily)